MDSVPHNSIFPRLPSLVLASSSPFTLVSSKGTSPAPLHRLASRRVRRRTRKVQPILDLSNFGTPHDDRDRGA